MRVRPVVGLVAGQRRLRAPHSPPTGGCGQGGGGGPWGPSVRHLVSAVWEAHAHGSFTGQTWPPLHPEAAWQDPPPSLLLVPGKPRTILTWSPGFWPSLSVSAFVPGDPSVPRLLFHPRGEPAGRGGNGESWGSGPWLLGSVVT